MHSNISKSVQENPSPANEEGPPEQFSNELNNKELIKIINKIFKDDDKSVNGKKLEKSIKTEEAAQVESVVVNDIEEITNALNKLVKSESENEASVNCVTESLNEEAKSNRKEDNVDLTIQTCIESIYYLFRILNIFFYKTCCAFSRGTNRNQKRGQ